MADWIPQGGAGKRIRNLALPGLAGLIMAWGLVWSSPAPAEYGDVVINEKAEDAGMRPVVFPHWFHRIRFRCKVCHADLGFKFQAGGSGINMKKIFEGKYCGECHNGKIAWGTQNCQMCHSGKKGLDTGVLESTDTRLIAPPSADDKEK